MATLFFNILTPTSFFLILNFFEKCFEDLKFFFIHWRHTKRDTGRGRHRQEAWCRTGSQNSRIIPWAKGRLSTAQPLSHPGIPTRTFLLSLDFSLPFTSDTSFFFKFAFSLIYIRHLTSSQHLYFWSKSHLQFRDFCIHSGKQRICFTIVFCSCICHAIVYYKHSHWNHPFESRSHELLLSLSQLPSACLPAVLLSKPNSTKWTEPSMVWPPIHLLSPLFLWCYFSHTDYFSANHSQACSSCKTFSLVVFPIGKLALHHLQWPPATFWFFLMPLSWWGIHWTQKIVVIILDLFSSLLILLYFFSKHFYYVT